MSSPTEALVKEDAVPVTFEDTREGAILNCRAEAETDSWFVTSIPWQDGMTILVDGEKATVEKVNTAFVGARIPAGTHEIEVRFCPSGEKGRAGHVGGGNRGSDPLPGPGPPEEKA